MSNYKTLETSIDREILVCVKEAEKLLTRAKQEGDIGVKSVLEIKEVQATRDYLAFMDLHKLIPGSRQHRLNFE